MAGNVKGGREMRTKFRKLNPILHNLARTDICVQLRTPEECHPPVRMETDDVYTITTGEAKIVVRKLGFRVIELMLIPSLYVKKNWGNCNSLDERE